jgi:glycosyltransferase involved in cell wall biosynthesis
MDGISFIVRVKNEENIIEKSIRSITGITVPYEIVVILNTCTDRSQEIVEKLKDEGYPIRIFTYDYQISRAGYEMLVTDSTSTHSMVEYTKWCCDKGQYSWLFRWDADFIASPQLIDLFNSRTWSAPEIHSRYNLQARNSDSNTAEPYLFSIPYSIIKYIYWEAIIPVGKSIDLDPGDAHMSHISSLKTPKSYWLDEPWFMNDSSDEATLIRKRFELLNTICGKEPIGSARSANPECEAQYLNVRRHKELLANCGINFYV